MITNDNLKWAFDNLNETEIEKAMGGNHDHVIFEVHTCNAGGFSSLRAEHYDEDRAQEIEGNGDLYMDKDQFLELVKESESVNPFLIKWL